MSGCGMNLKEAIYEFLGIPIQEQPADCYRLLGIARFESNTEVISNAAARQMLFVRQIASGPHAQISQDLLDLLAEAKRRLLNPERRRRYDAKLREDSIADFGGNSLYANLGGLPEEGAGSDTSHHSIWVAEPASLQESIQRALPGNGANGGSVVLPTPGQRVIAPFADAASRGSVLRASDSIAPSSHKREWVVGADSDCDIVVRCAYVSRRHCRVWETEGLFWVEDLGSRNGTYVNHQRIEGRQLVSEKDLVTLGTLARMPWPPEALSADTPNQVVSIRRIGRSASNDVVLDDSSVSRRHAQISLYADHTVIEDLGSTNGTYVGDSALPINRRRVEPTDMVRIGRFSMSVSHLLSAESVA